MRWGTGFLRKKWYWELGPLAIRGEGGKYVLPGVYLDE